MKKVGKALFNVLEKVLLIGFGVQIILGFCWMVMNFPEVPEFGETLRYLEASESIIKNGYRGILYPVLIVMTQGMERLVHIPYYCFLYLLQLVAAFGAAYRLLDAVGVKGRYRLCYGSLAMLTVPMAMQCHMAVLPDSLGASFWLLEWAYAILVLREQDSIKVGNIIKLGVCYALGVCLLPEFFFTGVLPVLAVLVREGVSLWKCSEKRAILRLVAISFFFFAGMSFVAHAGAVDQRSTGSIMASRFAWSYVLEDYEYWREEIGEYMPLEKIRSVAGYADSMDRIVAEQLVANVGEERAEELLLSMAKASFGRHTKENLKEILWDVYGYGFAPWVLREQLDGKGYEAYSGRNYEIMGMHTPRLAGIYMNYGSYLFVVGVFLAAASWLLSWNQNGGRWVEGEAVRKRMLSGNMAILLILGALGPVLYYSMQGAGMMDYKKTICVTLFWIVWVFRCTEEIEQ